MSEITCICNASKERMGILMGLLIKRLLKDHIAIELSMDIKKIGEQGSIRLRRKRSEGAGEMCAY
ncbi:MAG: hypothetical protein Q8N95_02610 [Desulfobacterales bacterium]|nr:hypothetical protein [Desulfobacterales bacterium]